MVRVAHKQFKTMGEHVSDQSAEMNSPPFFSLHAHRFVICMLLLFANYFVYANRLGMNTAVLCMVNSTLAANRSEDATKAQTCAVYHNVAVKGHEFAIPGTMQWTPTQQSLLVSATYYGSLITVAYSGIVAFRLGPDRVLTAVFLISTIVTLLIPTLSHTDYRLLLASRFLTGAVEGFHQPSISCLVTRWFPHGEKTIAAAIYTTGNQFAAGLSSLFAAHLCRSSLLGGWPSIFYVFGCSSLIFTAFFIIFGTGTPSKNRWLNEREKSFLAEKICSNKPEHRCTSIPRLLYSTRVHSILLCMFAFSFSTSLTHAFLPMYLRELGLPIETIPVKLILGPVIGFCTRSNVISLNAATKVAQSIGSFGAATALLLLATIPSCANAHIALPILILFGVVYAGGTCGFYTSFLSISPENMGVLSTLMTIFNLAGSVTASSIVNVLTALATPHKWTIIFAAGAILQAIGGLHFLIFGSTDVQKFG